MQWVVEHATKKGWQAEGYFNRLEYATAYMLDARMRSALAVGTPAFQSRDAAYFMTWLHKKILEAKQEVIRAAQQVDRDRKDTDGAEDPAGEEAADPGGVPAAGGGLR